MNTETIHLSSNSSSYIKYYDEISLNDNTKVILDFSRIFSTQIPINMIINWGDGNIQKFDHDFDGGVINTSGEETSMFQQTYSNIYYPSSTKLYKKITPQVLIMYADGNYSWFIIPLSIRTYGYFDSIYDIELSNTNIINSTSSPKQFQLKTNKSDQIIELWE